MKPWLAARLQREVAEGSDGRYRLAYDRLDVSLLGGSVTAGGLQLIPDSTAAYRVRIGRLRITGIDVLRLWLGRQVRVGSIVLDTPSVAMVRRPPADADSVEASRGSFLERLTRSVPDIRVKRIELREGQLVMTEAGSASRLHVQRLHAALGNIRLDERSLADTTRLYGAESVTLDIGTLDYLRPDSLYRLQLGPLHAETDANELTVDSLRYRATVDRAEFYRRVQLAKDIADIAIDRLRLTGIDRAAWVRRQLLKADALLLDSGRIALYKDKTQPNPPVNKIGNSPHQQLLRLAQPLAIDSVRVQGIDVRFTEVSDKTAKAGTVTFDGISGVFRNVTNDAATLAGDRFMRLHARTKVMGAGDLTVDFRFDLLDSLGGHTYTAALGPMDGTAFNRMLTPHLNVEVESAAIKGLRLDMAANDLRTEGTLLLDYNRLKVTFLEKDKGRETLVKRLLSFFANRMVLNDSNPDADGKRHTGNVYLQRPADFSFFKMIWRSIREGTMEVVTGG